MNSDIYNALANEGYIEAYQDEIRELFDSFISNPAVEYSDEQIIRSFKDNTGKNLINRLRKNKKEGKSLTDIKCKLLHAIMPSIEFSFFNYLIIPENFDIPGIESSFQMEVADRAVSEYTTYYAHLNLQKYKYDHAIRYFIRPKNFTVETFYDGDPYPYGIGIDKENVTLNCLTSELFLTGRMVYDPTGEIDGGLGAALYNGDNPYVSVSFSFSAYALYARSPRWLETLVESIQFYDAGLLFDALFKLFSSLDYIIEVAYKYIETLHKETMSNCSNEYIEISALFEKKYTGQDRRLIDEKLKCILDMCEVPLSKRNIIVGRFNKYQEYRNDIAHGEPLEDLSYERAHERIVEIMNEFYFTYFDFIYEITYKKGIIDCIELIIDYSDYGYEDSY